MSETKQSSDGDRGTPSDELGNASTANVNVGDAQHIVQEDIALLATDVADGDPSRGESVVREIVKRWGDEGLKTGALVADRYRIKEELKSGGMGRVLLAHDENLDREVAVKAMLDTRDDVARKRFEREATITASLQHAHIVPVFERGELPSGEPFYTMRRVKGETLAEKLEASTTRNERLGLLPYLVNASQAIAFAHARDVIHRDLKPSNIMIAENEETIVIDWGLAKNTQAESVDPTETSPVEESDGSLTVAGAVLGTLAYMPPEQARGEALDARADVYALGAILYELLVGRAPYVSRAKVGENALLLLLRSVRSGNPDPMVALRTESLVELVAIVRKAMHRDATQRYGDAGEFASDLQRYVRGQLVDAHRYSVRERVRRWAKQHWIALSVAAIAAMAMVATGVVSIARVVREKRRADERAVAARAAEAAQRRAAETARDQQLRAEKQSRLASVKGYVSLASTAFAQGLLAQGTAYLLAANADEFAPEGRREAMRAGLASVSRGPVMDVYPRAPERSVWLDLDRQRVIEQGTTGVRGLDVFSRSGAWTWMATESRPIQPMLFSVTGEEELEAGGQFFSLGRDATFAWSPSFSTHLKLGFSNLTIEIESPDGSEIEWVKNAPNGRIVFLTRTGHIYVWLTKERRTLGPWGDFRFVFTVGRLGPQLSEDGRVLALSADNKMHLLCLNDMNSESTLEVDAYHSEVTWLQAGAEDVTRCWDPRRVVVFGTGVPESKIPRLLVACSTSRMGQTPGLATCIDSRTQPTGNGSAVIDSWPGIVQTSKSENGSRLYFAVSDGKVRAIEADPDGTVRTLRPSNLSDPMPPATRMANRTGSVAWTTETDVMMWHGSDARVVGKVIGTPTSLAVSSGGTRVAVGTREGVVYVYSWLSREKESDETVQPIVLKTGREVDPNPEHATIRTLGFVSERVLVSVGSDRAVRRWELPEERRAVHEEKADPYSVGFGGDRVVFAQRDRLVWFDLQHVRHEVKYPAIAQNQAQASDWKVVVDPNGKLAVVALGTVLIRVPLEGAEPASRVEVLGEEPTGFLLAGFSHDGSVLGVVVTSKTTTRAIIFRRDGTVLKSLSTGEIVGFSGDGQWALTHAGQGQPENAFRMVSLNSDAIGVEVQLERRFLCSTGSRLVIGEKGKARFVEVTPSGLRVLQTLGNTCEPSAGFCDESRIVMGCNDGSVRIWEREETTPNVIHPFRTPVVSLAAHGDLLACASREESPVVWSMRELAPMATVPLTPEAPSFTLALDAQLEIPSLRTDEGRPGLWFASDGTLVHSADWRNRRFSSGNNALGFVTLPTRDWDVNAWVDKVWDRTNLRVCRDSSKLVPVALENGLPPKSPWAPASMCPARDESGDGTNTTWWDTATRSTN